MCNCISEIENKTRLDNDATFSRMEHFGRAASVVRLIPRKQDGAESKVSRYVFVDWQFCPFCGEKR